MSDLENSLTTVSNTNINVLYEDNHLIVVNKRPGDIVQGDKTGDAPLSDHVKAYIKKKYNKPGDVFLGTVHRLDRPTSGIILYARTSKALTRMNQLFKDKDIQKTYWAVTENSPKQEQGKLINWLKKNEKQNKSYVVKDGQGLSASLEVQNKLDSERNRGAQRKAKKAELDYKILGHSDRYHLLEITLHTGRHHQIRCQLAHIGCIIKGDLKYGAKRSNKDASIHLHARKLSFIHPVKKEPVVIEAKPPSDPIWDWFNEQSLV